MQLLPVADRVPKLCELCELLELCELPEFGELPEFWGLGPTPMSAESLARAWEAAAVPATLVELDIRLDTRGDLKITAQDTS